MFTCLHDVVGYALLGSMCLGTFCNVSCLDLHLYMLICLDSCSTMSKSTLRKGEGERVTLMTDGFIVLMEFQTSQSIRKHKINLLGPLIQSTHSEI